MVIRIIVFKLPFVGVFYTKIEYILIKNEQFYLILGAVFSIKSVTSIDICSGFSIEHQFHDECRAVCKYVLQEQIDDIRLINRGQKRCIRSWVTQCYALKGF